MKWSSPLPRLDWSHIIYSLTWAWSLTLYGPGNTTRDLALSLKLGHHEFLIGLTWPERNRL